MSCPGQNPYGVNTDADIRVPTDLEYIRRYPGMYVGSTDSRGLIHTLFQLVTNALAETVAGYGRSVRIALRADGSAEVADDGRILPSGTAVDRAFTSFLSTGRWEDCPYPTGRGYDQYTIANALAERLQVTVRSPSSLYQHVFRRGTFGAAVQSGGPPDDCGLTILFRPDPLIFGEARFDADTIRDRLRVLAFIHGGVRITLADEANGTRDEFEYTDGIREYVRFLNAARRPLHADPIVLRGEEPDVRYEVGLQWCEDEEQIVRSFANHHYTATGGTHERGLAKGVAAGVRDFIREHAPESGEFTGDDVRVGLTAVVSVWLADPAFESQSYSTLSNPEVEGVIKAAVRDGVRAHLEANPGAAERIVRAVVAARDARVAAMAIRKQKRNRAE